jgi:hypothetical protein
MVNGPWCIETMTSTETCKWMLCPEKYRRLHKSTKEDSTNMRTFEAIQLLDNVGIVRRLQRQKPFDLL